MSSEARIGMFLARAQVVRDLKERSLLLDLLRQLSSMHNIVVVAERRPKTMAKHGIGPKHIENARWVRDRLDEEIAGRITKAEQT